MAHPRNSPTDKVENLPHMERNFVLNLRNLRDRKGYNQSDLATLMQQRGWSKFNQMTLSRIERGERTVSFGEALELATLVNATLETMTLPPGHTESVQELIDWDLDLEERKMEITMLQGRLDRLHERALELAREADQIPSVGEFGDFAERSKEKVKRYAEMGVEKYVAEVLRHPLGPFRDIGRIDDDASEA